MYWKQYPQQKVHRKSHKQLVSNISILLDHHHALCFLSSFSSYLWVCETFLYSSGLQRIRWVKQDVEIPLNSSNPPETLAVLLSWKLGSTMPHYFLQPNWRLFELSHQSAPQLFFLFVFSSFNYGLYSVFGCCSVGYSLKCTEKIILPGTLCHLVHLFICFYLCLMYTILFWKT